MKQQLLYSGEDASVFLLDGGVVSKIAKTDKGREGLKNAWRFLKELSDTGFAPRPILLAYDCLKMEYIESEKITDISQAARMALVLIGTLQQRGIQHGDVEGCNIRFRDNSPVLLDWDEAVFVNEGKEPKRPEPDAYWLCLSLAEILRGESNAADS